MNTEVLIQNSIYQVANKYMGDFKGIAVCISGKIDIKRLVKF